MICPYRGQARQAQVAATHNSDDSAWTRLLAPYSKSQGDPCTAYDVSSSQGHTMIVRGMDFVETRTDACLTRSRSVALFLTVQNGRGDQKQEE